MEKTATLPLIQKKPVVRYTKGEEILNTLTHGLGALFGLAVMIAGIVRSAGNMLGIAASLVYGICMVITYTVSAVYHGLKPNAGKEVLRIIDHCAIYLLIMGTYTGIVLVGVFPYAPAAAIAVMAIEWALGILAITLTAIDMKKFGVFSMVCYLVLGWCIMAIPHIVIGALGLGGFLWLLSGGLAYTAGSVLYGMGRKKRYIHGVFHIFCLIGSVFHFVCFIAYCF